MGREYPYSKLYNIQFWNITKFSASNSKRKLRKQSRIWEGERDLMENPGVKIN